MQVLSINLNRQIASPEQMVRNARNVAIAGVALYTISQLPVANGSGFGECMADCVSKLKLNPVICAAICWFASGR